MNIRDIQQSDLRTIRDDWWIPITLTAPGGQIYNTAAGTEDALLGDVRHESRVFDPEVGDDVVVNRVTITIRIKDLERVPKEGEKWFVEYPENLLNDGTIIKRAFDYNDVNRGGLSMGWVKIMPKDAEVAV